jgi:DNA-binding NtrC family response regulator
MNAELESVIDAKIKPLVQAYQQKYLGIRVTDIEADITDQLKRSALLDIPIDAKMPYRQAKKAFKRAYLVRLLKQHLGNISTAADAAGIDRRSIHRLVLSLRLPASKLRENAQPAYSRKSPKGAFADPSTAVDDARQTAVKGIVEDVLESYKAALSPVKYDAFSRQSEALSGEIVKELPESHLTLKEAEKAFEREYFAQLLSQSASIAEAAKKTRLRYEVLHRKLKMLGLGRKMPEESR